MIRDGLLEQTRTFEGEGTESHTTAARATLQSLLNGFLRETALGVWQELDGRWQLEVPLASQGGSILVELKYRSLTGRHLFQFPLQWKGTGAEASAEDELVLAERLVLELGHQVKVEDSARTAELLQKIKESCAAIQHIVEARDGDRDQLYGFEGDFITAEQSLLFGHLLHPTPKSRDGVPESLNGVFSPELKGQFQLHYFRAHKSIVREDSALADTSATEWIKSDLRRADASLPFTETDAYTLIPLHPLQAEEVLAKPAVQKLIEAGLLENLGPLGRYYSATSSFRTMYHQESPFMPKGSVPVRITNSVRINLFKELERGVEVSRLLRTKVGEVSKEYPAFAIVNDPAYVSIALDGQEESGFEVVLRANPFQGEQAKQASLVASLVQDPLPGSESRLSTIIRQLAKQEGRSTGEVSLDWFRQYLAISLAPMIWLYETHGIALEAHQQNSVVQLHEGYPHKYYYRDNQGYYFCNSMKEHLSKELPGIGEKSQTFCEDAVADERFRYYVIFNHLFGLINGFGTAGLADERELLRELRGVLEQFLPMNREPSIFLKSLLTEAKIPCKANLLTRLYDMDELVGSLENQSVYVLVDNPLVTEV
ncbi:IucA/IucC family siderophore biosynthesis protein [Paenibacillus pasadenensis]|uniref:IucA/IucC family protein n=1 Tax=Paenibacillus pasadenensis TaxID=217090 RepID=UPI0020424AEB|nr:IucA/IucC family protein [Paenibacillus pasadenensis]MCM3747844.1 IucA/IucC family siderophore biosynthesis protein [Paenibacillus pasadenensis]